MAFAGDVCRDFRAVGESDAGHLAESGVWLLGGHDLDLKANSAFLGTADKGRMLRPAVLLDARLAHQLIDRGHSLLQAWGRFATGQIHRPVANRPQIVASSTLHGQSRK